MLPVLLNCRLRLIPPQSCPKVALTARLLLSEIERQASRSTYQLRLDYSGRRSSLCVPLDRHLAPIPPRSSQKVALAACLPLVLFEREASSHGPPVSLGSIYRARKEDLTVHLSARVQILDSSLHLVLKR